MSNLKFAITLLACASLFALGGCADDDDDGGGSGGGGGGGNPFVEISSSFSNVTTGQPFTVTVQLNDSNGDPDTTSTDMVTLSLASNPGFNIIHQGGNGDRMVDLIDADTGTMLQILSSDEAVNETTGMVYRASTNEIFATERSSDNFYSINPDDGTYTTIGTGTLAETIRGLAFNGMGELIGARQSSNELMTIDTTTGVETLRTAVTITGDTINAFNGFARDPSSGTFFAIAQLSSAGSTSSRFLVTVNVGSGTATLIGQMNNGCSALAFDPAGNLFACTGDGGTPSEVLLSVDKTTGLGTQIMDIDIGDDGDCVTSVPARLGGTLTVAAVAGVATFNVWLSAPGTGYTIQAARAGGGTHTGSSFDVTTPPTTATIDFTNSTSNAAEAVGTHQIAISLSAAQPHNVWLTWEITGGTATEGSDYTAGTFGSAMIPAGSTTGTVDIPIIDDATVDVGETIVFTVHHAGLGTVGTMTTHTVTIVDDD